jgi:hypothetical protein
MLKGSSHQLNIFLKAFTIKSVISVQVQIVFKLKFKRKINMTFLLACTFMAGFRNSFQNHRRTTFGDTGGFQSRNKLSEEVYQKDVHS